MIARLISIFRKPEPSLYERAMAEITRRETEARKKHGKVCVYHAMKRELVRRNLNGELS
jgi:hypothetical protein